MFAESTRSPPNACSTRSTQAERAGLLGSDVAGSGRAFRISVFRGAGAYICGEETALFNSVEGRRGEPRNKPPFPTQVGLFGDPTLVNNVETLCNVPLILTRGRGQLPPVRDRPVGRARSCSASAATSSGRGSTRCRSGCPSESCSRSPAASGGAAASRRCSAAARRARFSDPTAWAYRSRSKTSRAVGGTLGSGAVIVLDETARLWDVVLRVARFFQEESCGQCVPCRVGTQRQLEIVARLAAGGRDSRTMPMLLREIGAAMTDASICGLGQTAAGAVLSALALKGGARRDGLDRDRRAAGGRGRRA